MHEHKKANILIPSIPFLYACLASLTYKRSISVGPYSKTLEGTNIQIQMYTYTCTCIQYVDWDD